MGYYSTFSFSKLQGSKEEYEAFMKDLEEIAEEPGLAEEESVYTKWYDFDEDIQNVAKKHPNVLVEAEIRGEDGEIWFTRVKGKKFYAADGKTTYRLPKDTALLTDEEAKNLEDDNDSSTEDESQELLCETIQNITLEAWPLLYGGKNKHDLDSKAVLSTFREWGKEFEKDWRGKEDSEEKDYMVDLQEFVRKKVRDFLASMTNKPVIKKVTRKNGVPVKVEIDGLDGGTCAMHVKETKTKW